MHAVLGLLSSPRIAHTATVLFLYGPASIFYHVAYTESLFALVALTAIRLALAHQSVRTATLLLCLATCLRSNGMFLSPIVGLGIL